MKNDIMIIDDTQDTVEVTKVVLELGGFKVEDFTDAKAAMERLKGGYHPDLILLDMRMPDLPGPKFCEMLRSDDKLKDLRVVFFTASSDLDHELAKKYNVLGFIFKPYDNKVIIRDIKKYLKK